MVSLSQSLPIEPHYCGLNSFMESMESSQPSRVTSGWWWAPWLRSWGQALAVVLARPGSTRACSLLSLLHRIAVFSVTVLHDERIVIVAEQRPDSTEEDSFQWMSRVLQVPLVPVPLNWKWGIQRPEFMSLVPSVMWEVARHSFRFSFWNKFFFSTFLPLVC